MASKEHHKSHRTGPMRAAVLGCNDGIVSISSLIIGVAAANTLPGDIILAGIAGLIAGAMSMAAGEYVSVSSQADIEAADLDLERVSIAQDYSSELDELKDIYVARGVSEPTAWDVAKQLMEHDALGAHAHDELGISTNLKARPIQAASYSASMFSIGASVPLIATLVSPAPYIIVSTAVATILSLIALGAGSAIMSGAPLFRPTLRVTFWGCLAMGVTASIGRLLGLVI